MNNFQRYLLLAGLLASASAHAQKNPDLIAEEVGRNGFALRGKAGRSTIGVEVITSEQIRDSGVRTVPELLSRQAGIYTRDNSGSPNQPN
jgi:outer membrane cobalamin receptor